MRDEYKSLLERITARHNAEIQQRHDAGELDFVPTDRTPETMLETIIALYARDNYPDLLTGDEPPQTKPAEKIALFYNDEHEKAFWNFLARAGKRFDSYHFSIAYLLTLDKECRKHLDDLFDFEDDGIKHKGIDKAWQTGTSKKTTRLAFNLWNGCYRDDGECEDGLPANPLYTPSEIFCSSYARYYYEGIKLRYPEYTGE